MEQTTSQTLPPHAPSAPAGAARRSYDAFASLAHELRTPLNSINGFLDILLDEMVGPLNERQREFLGYVQVSASQLTTLIEDMLLIAKADAGQLTLRRDATRLANLVEQVAGDLAPALDQAGARLIVDLAPDLPPFEADAALLGQALGKLLARAIAVTPAHGEVTFEARALEGALRIGVRDQGAAVPPEERARLFERVTTPAGGRGRTPGDLLGLAVVKLIVERHGGSVWLADDQPGGAGATFVVALPLERA